MNNLLLRTESPSFGALTGTQPVGSTQVAVAATYAGTVFTVKRTAERYWHCATRSARGFVRAPKTGASAMIWFDETEGRYVVDYWADNMTVEVDRTRSLQAAIGVAEWHTADRWAAGPCRR